MSDNGVPDLGGINNEEAFFADEVCITGFFLPFGFSGLCHDLLPSPCFFIFFATVEVIN